MNLKEHRGQHPDDEDGPCFGCKLASIQFGGDPEVAKTDKVEKELFERDRDAYYRLRKEGIRPRSIRGCDELEAKAVSQRDIEMGWVVSPLAWKQVGSQIDEAEHVIREAAVKPNNSDARALGDEQRKRAEQGAYPW